MFNKIANSASNAESFLTTGWVRFIGIPIVIGLLAGVYFLLSH